MQVLVTGGAGFIGSHLVEHLVATGDHVRVLDNFSTGSLDRLAHLGTDVQVHTGDVRDTGALAAAAEGTEVIYHLAAIVSVVQSVAQPVETFDVNLTGTLQVLEAARRAGIRRVILASTCAVYGDTHKLPVSEQDPPAPLSPYAASKLAAEEALKLYTRLHGLETVSLRFFNVYGPRQDPTSPYAAVVPRFIAALRAGGQPTIYGDGLQTRDFIYVGDIVESLRAAATLPGIAGAVFNVGRGEETSVLDLAETIGACLGREVHPIFAPPREGEVRRSRADVSAFAAAGFRARVTLREGLARTIEAG
ncbi:MAG: GDP-mannose 4,6-dehydratase [Oscillochloridaceae bacterium]|nr:GDP-mannose 4,6-dehydratase [Chloroflexaceae bacterium]MDW8388712.1 GDP-mannose 4,6-dehydratase [Oscillochloridaceae bacterium]